MFSLQNLLREEDKLLSLLEASALQARASVQALLSVTQNPDTPLGTQNVAYSRLKDREITDAIRHELFMTFITALDPEDIESLSSALYKIPKIAGKFGERLHTSPEFVRAIDFSWQIRNLDQATEVLVQLVGSLQRTLILEEVKTLNDRLQFMEGEADKHMVSVYRTLFSGRYTAVQVLVLKDLYELLEKLTDRCRDVGNIIAHIALRNC
jgi:uncharacterized protein Yka (UPF0111/DUF47 family)